MNKRQKKKFEKKCYVKKYCNVVSAVVCAILYEMFDTFGNGCTANVPSEPRGVAKLRNDAHVELKEGVVS